MQRCVRRDPVMRLLQKVKMAVNIADGIGVHAKPLTRKPGGFHIHRTPVKYFGQSEGSSHGHLSDRFTTQVFPEITARIAVREWYRGNGLPEKGAKRLPALRHIKVQETRSASLGHQAMEGDKGGGAVSSIAVELPQAEEAAPDTLRSWSLRQTRRGSPRHQRQNPISKAVGNARSSRDGYAGSRRAVTRAVETSTPPSNIAVTPLVLLRISVIRP